MKIAPVILPLFGYDQLACDLQHSLGYTLGKMSIHRFPDDEIVVTIDSVVNGLEVILIGSLDHPNPKMAPLLFAAETAKTLGATKVGLIAPYLAYMRQDKQFHPGEGITSAYFADLISHHVDWMVTIDPHLHRWHSLDDIYTIPTRVLHAMPCIAAWIKKNCDDPLLIGPDSESTQWVLELATKLNAPFLILEKERSGDRLVNISIPDIAAHHHRTPILIDDIISTGTTMIGTVAHLNSLKMKPAICIGIHAIFAGNAYQDLLNSGVKTIVTCNTIEHPSNDIDISSLIIDSLRSGF